MYTNDQLIQKALEYVNSNNRVYKQIRLSAPPPPRTRAFNIQAANPSNDAATFVTEMNNISPADWKREFISKNWKDVYITESPVAGVLKYVAIPDALSHSPDVDLPEIPMVLKPDGTYEKGKHSGSYSIDYPDNYIQKYINTKFDNEGKYNLGWHSGSFLAWWKDLYRMKSAPTSDTVDEYVHSAIRQALLQKIPHFGHTNYKDFTKYRKVNPTFKNSKGVESVLPDNDLLRSMGLGDSYTLYELGMARDLEPGVHIDANLLQAALGNLLQPLSELKKKFEDPAEYERQYLAEIEKRKKMMIEKQKKWQEGLNKGSKILTNILGLGDDVKRGKYE
jgi:hypothetical protein